ncbi:uncharacterized protein FOBCDRAFT_206594 [Fusarium oxysporum Fo47]|uniref:uncharacterized protein n=1 Tax=Fusarium oxysporum Fo47 TaxID=660027 RepID=UPI002869BFC6|nr:uncharacterized protein FOBCDRAFT_206594 [Fusarium oxysporum Fo47]WJG36156.1 hypothetical protein FOBCDRAFT_206594 [Fusarium oxysporum Fo47]
MRSVRRPNGNGEECEHLAEHLPDKYQFGLSGSLNLTEAVLQDIEQYEPSTPGEECTLQKCKDVINKQVDHQSAQSLGRFLFWFLICSVITNIASFYVMHKTCSIFHLFTTLILGLDTMFLFASLALCFVAMSYEAGPYLKEVELSEFSDMEMIGPAFWALLSILIGRLISNPPLLLGVIPLVVPMAVISYFLVHMKGFFTIVSTTVVEDLTRMAPPEGM